MIDMTQRLPCTIDTYIGFDLERAKHIKKGTRVVFAVDERLNVTGWAFEDEAERVTKRDNKPA